MNEHTEKKPARQLMPWIIAAVAVAVVAGAGAIAAMNGGLMGRNEASAAMTFAAVQGPLTISVSESGTIRSRQLEVLKSEVEGQTTILYLIPEGTMVKKGELLVELDASRLQDQQIEQEIRVQNAEAAWIRARENLEVVRNQTQSDVARATLDYQFANEDLQKYLEGDYPKEVKEVEARITLAQEENRRAMEKLEWSRRLFEEKYVSQTELQADELSLERARLDLELAQGNLYLLQNWTHRRRLTELKSNIDQAQMALVRVKLRSNADIVQAQADLRAKEAEHRQQQNQLARTLKQIERTRITAPTDGLVVYATSAQGGGFRGNQEPLAEGQQVRERQDLIHLPTATSVMAEIKVHEASLEKVRAGLPVRVTVDALPGRVFTGRVARIAPLPDAQSIWANPDLKVYNTDIHIDGDGSELRTGMTCRAEIIVAHYTDAVYVPVQSVMRVGRQPMVYVHDGRQTTPRPIELGLDNNRMARIIDGLQPGEKVLLNPPLSDATADMNDEQFASATPVIPTAAGNGPPVPAVNSEPPAAGGAVDDQVMPQQERGGDRPRGERRAGGGERGAGMGGERGPGQGGVSEEERPQRRRQMENMSPEQMSEMRRQFENMTPEQREAMRQQWQQRQQEE
jgi:HlyD family secretion protein